MDGNRNCYNRQKYARHNLRVWNQPRIIGNFQFHKKFPFSFSAMSAKTESNMNILNVYKGKPDLYNEPMRKRSSSATEASKPINVLQKRQNPIEIRNSFSPQYNSK